MPPFLTLLLTALLCALLALAVASDVRSRRIPNLLVLLGMIAGLTLHTLLPAGDGLFRQPFGALGFTSALAGLGLGLALLLPLYMLGAMGAGDAKLMAMVGAFLGPLAVLDAALLSLLAGGVLSLAVALWSGTLMRVLTNVHQLLLQTLLRARTGGGAAIDAPPDTSGQLPYAIAIAAGTLLQLALQQRGIGLLS
jgi:prepilin peptidase CpaA